MRLNLNEFLTDDDIHTLWGIAGRIIDSGAIIDDQDYEISLSLLKDEPNNYYESLSEGYDVSNAELSMRLYDQELEENIEHDMENLLGSQSEGKDFDYGSKVDALVDSMGVSDKLVSQRHERRDLDAL